ncbi:hypothetical protein Btru_071220 [Bulinus truncatus]|nr:hypothetical protein Btru_071220 [Bulinus truncatus]
MESKVLSLLFTTLPLKIKDRLAITAHVLERSQPPASAVVPESAMTLDGFFSFGQLSGMWLRWSLTTLYLLQLLVLSSMVAAYIMNNVSRARAQGPPQNLSRLAADELPAKIQQTGDDNISVELMPLSLADIQSSLRNVTSPVDLVRLFSRTDVSDEQIVHFLESRQQQHVPDDRRASEQLDSGQSEKSKKKDGPVNGAGLEGWGEDPGDYASDQSSSHQHEVFLAAVHNGLTQNDMANSPCKAPTPFVHYVHDPTHPDKYFLPECVLLHRCFNYSGCCRSRMLECVPKKVDIVQMAFLTFKIDDHGTTLMNFDTGDAVLLPFENHTECECRPKRQTTNLSSCPLRCPAPFTLKEWGTDCTCGCSPVGHEGRFDDECKKIRKGRMMLGESGLVCIKENNCYQPSCDAGSFNLLTGFCPLADEYALPRYMFNSSENKQRIFREHLNNGHLSYTTAPPPTFRFFSRTTPAPTTSPWRPQEIGHWKELLPFSSHSYHENAKSRKRNGTKADALVVTALLNRTSPLSNISQEVSQTLGSSHVTAKNATQAALPDSKSSSSSHGNASIPLGVSWSSHAFHENSHRRLRNGTRDRQKPRNGRKTRKKTVPTTTSRVHIDNPFGRGSDASSSHAYHENSHNRMRDGARDRQKEPPGKSTSFNAPSPSARTSTARGPPSFNAHRAHTNSTTARHTPSTTKAPVNASARPTNGEPLAPPKHSAARPNLDMPRGTYANKDGFSKRSLRHHSNLAPDGAPELVSEKRLSTESSEEEEMNSELRESSWSDSDSDSEGSGDDDDD